MLARSSSVDKGSTSGQCGVCLLTVVAPLGWREHKESWLRSVRMSVNNGGATGYLQQSGLLIKVMVQRGEKNNLAEQREAQNIRRTHRYTAEGARRGDCVTDENAREVTRGTAQKASNKVSY